jgi:hypothetical protein
MARMRTVAWLGIAGSGCIGGSLIHDHEEPMRAGCRFARSVMNVK